MKNAPAALALLYCCGHVFLLPAFQEFKCFNTILDRALM
jgi:hypothetical protein